MKMTKWNKNTEALFAHIEAIFEKLVDYRPLTLRQVFYQLVKGLIIENTISRYASLSRLLVQARVKGRIPWEWMIDETRFMLSQSVSVDRSSFIDREVGWFLKKYRRDLLANQQTRLEVWIEKAALCHIAERAADPYTVPVLVARGYSSKSFMYDCVTRICQHAEKGQRTHILYFGDLDPSGWDMLRGMIRDFQEMFHLGDWLHSDRVALNPEQVFEYDLPLDPDAMKEGDTRTPKYKEWLREQGYQDDLSVELDALEPDDLLSLVRGAIEKNIDKPTFLDDQAQEREDLDAIASQRQLCVEAIAPILNIMGVDDEN